MWTRGTWRDDHLWSLPRHPPLQAAVLAAGAAGRRQQGCLCVGGGVYQAACASAAAATRLPVRRRRRRPTRPAPPPSTRCSWSGTPPPVAPSSPSTRRARTWWWSVPASTRPFGTVSPMKQPPSRRERGGGTPTPRGATCWGSFGAAVGRGRRFRRPTGRVAAPFCVPTTTRGRRGWGGGGGALDASAGEP